MLSVAWLPGVVVGVCVCLGFGGSVWGLLLWLGIGLCYCYGGLVGYGSLLVFDWFVLFFGCCYIGI